MVEQSIEEMTLCYRLSGNYARFAETGAIGSIQCGEVKEVPT
jgi:hypothetical protein